MKFEDSPSFAKTLDKRDPLKKFRAEFHLPKVHGSQALYLCGNSLGLQPRNVKQFLTEELSDWANLGVEGHFLSRRPWLYYHKFAKKALSKLVGAKPSEVVAMNQLTVNLHLMLTSFYRPTPGRYKIIAEAGAFSSDQYAIESQIQLHGLKPADALIEVSPRPGEYTLRLEDILSTIKTHKDQLSLVIFGGVQYYSGQFFNLKEIAKAAHEAGAFAGFDLAHAIGNVPLNLHNDNVDFAVWCSYKYLNSGPGSVAGAFVHDRHATNQDILRMAGWWGHHEKDRFKMKKGFIPMPGIDGWQLSNFPVFSGAAHQASLDLFERAGIKSLRKKSLLLTGYLEFLLKGIDPDQRTFSIITPSSPSERGCQLSILMKHNGKKIFDRISKKGVVADWRESDLTKDGTGVIRVAPVPMYNTFEETLKFARLFKEAITR